MIKVYQTIVDNGYGNCMQAAFASLLELPLDEVPHFLMLGDKWFSSIYEVMKNHGYDYDGSIYNKNYNRLIHPTDNCFKKEKWYYPHLMTKDKLHKEDGVKGYFYASVLSPKYFNYKDGFSSTHAVIVDQDYNVVHDPNPEYKNLVGYPLNKILGYNGITSVWLFNPIK